MALFLDRLGHNWRFFAASKFMMVIWIMNWDNKKIFFSGASRNQYLRFNNTKFWSRLFYWHGWLVYDAHYGTPRRHKAFISVRKCLCHSGRCILPRIRFRLLFILFSYLYAQFLMNIIELKIFLRSRSKRIFSKRFWLHLDAHHNCPHLYFICSFYVPA